MKSCNGPVSKLLPLMVVLAMVPLSDSSPSNESWYGYPFGPDAGDRSLPYGDDIFSEPVQLNPPFVFYGKKYHQVYVSSNGAVSFNQGIGEYTPDPFPFELDTPIIAPYWADIDTSRNQTYQGSNRGEVYYRNTTDSTDLSIFAQDIRRLNSAANFQPLAVLIVTWWHTTFYVKSPRTLGSPLPENSFQLVLATDGEASFAAFMYGELVWTAGERSEGDPASGLITSPQHEGHQALAGFDAGNQENFYQIGLSGSSEVLKLAEQSNVNQRGLWVYQVNFHHIAGPGCAPMHSKSCQPHQVYNKQKRTCIDVVPACECPYMVGPLLRGRELAVRCVWKNSSVLPPDGRGDAHAMHQVVFLFDGKRSKRVTPFLVPASSGFAELPEKYMHHMLGKQITCQLKTFWSDKPGILSGEYQSTNYTTIAVQVETGFPRGKPILLKEDSLGGQQVQLRLPHQAYCRGQPCSVSVPVISTNNIGAKDMRSSDTKPCRLVLATDSAGGTEGRLNVRAWPFAYLDDRQHTANISFGPMKAPGSIWDGHVMPSIQVAIQPAAVAMCSITRMGITTFVRRVFHRAHPGQVLVWKMQLNNTIAEVHVRYHHCPDGGSPCPCGVMVRDGASLLGLDMCESVNVKPADYLSRVRIMGKLGYGATVTKDDTGRHFSLNMPSGFNVKARVHTWGMGVYIYTLPQEGKVQGLCEAEDACSSHTDALSLVGKPDKVQLRRQRRSTNNTEEDLKPDSLTDPESDNRVDSRYQNNTSTVNTPGNNVTVLPPSVAPQQYYHCSIPRGESLFEMLPPGVFLDTNIHCQCDQKTSMAGKCGVPVYNNTAGRPNLEAAAMSIDPWTPATYTFDYGEGYQPGVKGDKEADSWCKAAVSSSRECQVCLTEVGRVGKAETGTYYRQELVEWLAERVINKCIVALNGTSGGRANITKDQRHWLRRVVAEELREGCLQIAYDLAAAYNQTSGQHSFAPARDYLSHLCEPGCEQHGRCEQGTCRCQQGYEGLDCMARKPHPVMLSEAYMEGRRCSVLRGDCPAFLSYRVDPVRQTGNLICSLRYNCIGPDYPVGGVKRMSAVATTVSYNELRCPIPDPGYWVLGCPGRKQHPYLISLCNPQKQPHCYGNTVNFTITCETCQMTVTPVPITTTLLMTPVCKHDCSGNGNCLSDGTCECFEGFSGSYCSLIRGNPEPQQETDWVDLGSCTLEHRDCKSQLTIPVTQLIEGEIMCHTQYKKLLSDGSWQVEGQTVVEEGTRISGDILLCPLPDESWWLKPDTTGKAHAFDITFSVSGGFRTVGGRYIIRCLSCPEASVSYRATSAPTRLGSSQPVGVFIALGVIVVLLVVFTVGLAYWKRRTRMYKKRRNQMDKMRKSGWRRPTAPMKVPPLGYLGSELVTPMLAGPTDTGKGYKTPYGVSLDHMGVPIKTPVGRLYLPHSPHRLNLARLVTPAKTR